MMLFIPVRHDFSFLKSAPPWFVRGFVVVYGLAYVAMLAALGYAIWDYFS